MRLLKPTVHSLLALASFSALALFWCAPVVTAQGQEDDPVENLRKLIKKNVEGQAELDARRIALDTAQQKLKTITDLRLALALPEWQDPRTLISPAAKVDQEIRTKIGKRLEEILQSFVASGDRQPKMAMADLLADMGTSIRGLDEGKTSFAASLAPSLYALMKSNDPLVTTKAARAVGKINPEPKAAVAALKEMLQASKQTQERRAAAESLAELVSTIAQLEKKQRVGDSGGKRDPGDVFGCAVEVVPAAGACLKDSDAVVRRKGLEALLQAATALSELVPPLGKLINLPASDEKWTPDQQAAVDAYKKSILEDWAVLLPVMEVLKAEGENLAGSLDDRDPEASVLSRRVLEVLGLARLRLLQLQNSVPKEKDGPAFRLPADVLLDAVRPSLAKIPQRINDANPEVRKLSVAFLENLGSDAVSAADALIAALADKKFYVRWAAARTLGDVGLDFKNRPEQSERTVKALGALLNPDEDGDVRAVVANTLREFGPDAKGALPALIKMLNVGEAASQEEVIRAIQAIGGVEGQAAIKALVVSLDSRSANVRRLAAEALGSMGPRAREAIAALQQHGQDEDQTVRQAINDAVLNILRQQ